MAWSLVALLSCLPYLYFYAGLCQNLKCVRWDVTTICQVKPLKCHNISKYAAAFVICFAFVHWHESCTCQPIVYLHLLIVNLCGENTWQNWYTYFIAVKSSHWIGTWVFIRVLHGYERCSASITFWYVGPLVVMFHCRLAGHRKLVNAGFLFAHEIEYDIAKSWPATMQVLLIAHSSLW